LLDLTNCKFQLQFWNFQRLRSFAIVSSKKHKEFKKCKYVLAVKIDTPLLKNCGGVTMDLVQKVIDAVGGVDNTPCASFLSQLEIYDDQLGLISKTNTQQHRAILFPISNFFSSSLILKIAAGKLHTHWFDHDYQTTLALDNPQLCQLADEETPTSTSGNLGTSGRAVVDDEEDEDYNDISSKSLPRWLGVTENIFFFSAPCGLPYQFHSSWEQTWGRVSSYPGAVQNICSICATWADSYSSQ
jgi:hypothetical protein